MDIQKSLKVENAEIRYLGSSKFSVSVKSKDYKSANALISQIIEAIKQKGKENNVLVSTKEK